MAGVRRVRPPHAFARTQVMPAKTPDRGLWVETKRGGEANSIHNYTDIVKAHFWVKRQCGPEPVARSFPRGKRGNELASRYTSNLARDLRVQALSDSARSCSIQEASRGFGRALSLMEHARTCALSTWLWHTSPRGKLGVCLLSVEQRHFLAGRQVLANKDCSGRTTPGRIGINQERIIR